MKIRILRSWLWAIHTIYDEADPIGRKIAEPALPEHLATGRDNELAKMELFKYI